MSRSVDAAAPTAGEGAELFAAWAEVAAAIGATASKREKVRLASGYLGGLSCEGAAVAARFFAGRVFAVSDPRVLGIGGAALARILRVLAPIDEAVLGRLWRRYADAASVVFDVVAHHGGDPPGGTLTLGDVTTALGAVADAGRAPVREELLLDLMRRCSAREAAGVVKLITGDLRVGLREGLVEEAIGVVFGAAAPLVQRAVMLTGDLGEVARLACTGDLETAEPRLFSPLRFMLASPAASAAEVVERLGEEVWVEDKYDGIRCQLHAAGGRVALFSRDLKEITGQFPDVAEGSWPEGVILDGEILAFREGRVLPFFALQRRLGRKNPSAAMRAEVPVVYVAWDVLHEGAEPLLDEPLRVRRERLEALALPGHAVLSHREVMRGEAALDEQFAAARARLNEGLMVKDPGSAYLPGRRGYHWLKLKRPLDTLDVVVVGAEYGHGKRHGVLSDVTFAVRDEDAGLVTVGKAYTGLTDAEIAEMTDLLHELSTAQYGSYHAVVPQIVLEIAFDSVQESKRHKSGYALRFPRIVRWRRDKGVEDADTLERVRAIATARADEFTQRVEPAGETAGP